MKKDLTHQLPKARTEQLIVKEVDDEVLRILGHINRDKFVQVALDPSSGRE